MFNFPSRNGVKFSLVERTIYNDLLSFGIDFFEFLCFRPRFVIGIDKNETGWRKNG